MKFHHIGIAVKSIQAAVKSFNSSLGWELSSDTIHDPIQKVFVCFMIDTSGIAYELIEPSDEKSPVIRLLSRNVSMYHVCYEVEDIAQNIRILRSKGYIQIAKVTPAIAFNNRKIAFLINRDHFIVELLEKNG